MPVVIGYLLSLFAMGHYHYQGCILFLVCIHVLLHRIKEAERKTSWLASSLYLFSTLLCVGLSEGREDRTAMTWPHLVWFGLWVWKKHFPPVTCFLWMRHWRYTYLCVCIYGFALWYVLIGIVIMRVQLLQPKLMSYTYKEQTMYFHELKRREILQMVLLPLNFSVSI